MRKSPNDPAEAGDPAEPVEPADRPDLADPQDPSDFRTRPPMQAFDAIDHSKRDFICPECGSTRSSGRLFVSRGPESPGDDPWAGVLQIVTCEGCHRTIPAHLAYRWGMSLEAAQAQWHARYRDAPTAREQPE